MLCREGRRLPGKYTSESKKNEQKCWERSREAMMCLQAGGGDDSIPGSFYVCK